MTRRVLAFALVRVALGLMYLLYGLGKLRGGVWAFAEGMRGAFAETWVPGGVAWAFALGLPFAEVSLGILLTLGLRTPSALFGAGALGLGLLAGTVVLGDTTAAAQNVVYIALIASLLACAEHDGLSLDARWP